MRKLIIAVEGMDGVGKTTVCNYVESTRSYLMVEKPTKYLLEDQNGNIDEELYNRILGDIYNASPYLRTTFFGIGNIVAITKFKNKNLILDRHLVSNYFWNSDEKLDYIYQLIIEQCGVPDLTILLYATPETRYKRLYKRNKKDFDLFDSEIFKDGTDKMIRFLNKFNLRYLFLNTEGKSIRTVCNEIDCIIDNLEREVTDK